jgi:glycosyltransferase involved in cell wall biosynthesis
MKVAIVHYWLTGMRGGEQVLEAIGELYPNADIYTHVYDPESVWPSLRQHRIETRFIQRLPWAKRFYQSYLPLMPLALESLDLSEYDLVISSESGPAKGIIVRPDARHLCYCHTPMRYVWDMYHDYRKEAGWLKRWLMAPIAHYLRYWDVTAASRVDQFVTNSEFVAQRVARYYRRSSVVVHPPVDVERFRVTESNDGFYLMVGQLVSYKRADLAVEAFNKMGRRLVIVGTGEQRKTLERRAGNNIEFVGWASSQDVEQYYSSCRALVFPGCEDFGIVPVEAMASGRPVIAYGRGGATETVIDGKTGVLFNEQTVDALIAAVEQFEAMEADFSKDVIRKRAEEFDKGHFMDSMRRHIDELMGLS